MEKAKSTEKEPEKSKEEDEEESDEGNRGQKRKFEEQGDDSLQENEKSPIEKGKKLNKAKNVRILSTFDNWFRSSTTSEFVSLIGVPLLINAASDFHGNKSIFACTRTEIDQIGSVFRAGTMCYTRGGKSKATRWVLQRH